MTLTPIESLTNLPQGWEARRLKFIVDRFYSGGTPSTTNPEYWNGEHPWVSSKDMKSAEILDTEDHITELALEETNLRLLPPGQILMVVRSGILRHTIPVAINSVPTTVNQDIKALALSDDVVPKFVSYIIKGMEDTWLSRWRKQGTTVESLEYDFYANDFIPIPPVATQTKIVAYLDRRCGEIDDLIAKKRGLLGLLAEKRSALITRAVTKGLDPTAPMKPSGIDWLGDIPAHWDASFRLKFLTTVSGGLTPATANADYWRGDIPWVSPKDMKVFDIADSEDHVTELALEETSLSLIDPGAVLFVVRGMILAHTFPIAVNSVAITVNQDMKALRCGDRLTPKFLAYFLRGIDRHILSLVDTSAHGTKALRSESWRELNVPLPPLVEQSTILSKIDDGLAEIDKSAALIRSAIDQLTEYRAAIITKAVTGELEVT